MKSWIPFFSAFVFCIVLSPGINAQQSKPGAAAQQDPVYIPPSEKGGRKVTAKETQGLVTVQEVVVQPGVGPPPHRHSREDEGFYVLEGQYEFRVGNRVIPATAGSYLFAPRGIPHAYKNVGTTPSKHLTIISPAGLERYFDELTALRKELPTTDAAYPGRLKALAEKYGLEYNDDWFFPPKAPE